VRAKFSTWLFAIAGNLCRNYLRWRRRLGDSVLESWDTEDVELAELLRSPDDSPLIRSESNAITREAIRKLPHNLNVVILLYEYEDLSCEEISFVLRCSAKSVEMKLYRARKLLREVLLHSEVR
jgi:RNA polymerase sigma-70 factor (ECF subfamily)